MFQMSVVTVGLLIFLQIVRRTRLLGSYGEVKQECREELISYVSYIQCCQWLNVN